jgi:hypothetical protein
MAERRVVQIVECTDTSFVVVCSDGKVWVNRGGIQSGAWQKIIAPPGEEPGKWGTSTVRGP